MRSLPVLLLIAACGSSHEVQRAKPSSRSSVSSALHAEPPPQQPLAATPADDPGQTPTLSDAQQAIAAECGRAFATARSPYFDYTMVERGGVYSFALQGQGRYDRDPQDVELALPVARAPVRLTHPIGAVLTIDDPQTSTEHVPIAQGTCYRRAHGFAFWTRDNSHFRVLFAELDPSEIQLDVAGLTPRQAGDAVELVDATGAVLFRLTITAWGRAGDATLVAGAPAGGRTRVSGKGRGRGMFLIQVEGRTWRDAGENFARVGHTLTALPDGRVLLVGGYSHIGMAGNGEPNETRMPDRSTAMIFDPKQNEWTAVPNPLSGPRSEHQAVALASGRVLVVGGDGFSSALALPEMFDPKAGSWILAGRLSVEPSRKEHAMVRLADGRVLLTGGRGAAGAMLRSAVLFDSAHGTWTPAADMLRPHAAHTLTVLADGRVLAVGKTAELYDPKRDRWTPAATPSGRRSKHAAVVLRDGRVLIAGGRDDDGPLATAELYDVKRDRWTVAAALPAAIADATALVTGTGRVALVGGSDRFQVGVSNVVLYDPARDRWERGAPFGDADGVRLAQLPDGDVLVVGTRNANRAGGLRCGHACGLDR